MNLPFHIVDVFAEEKYAGNQLAVFLDDEGISSELMQRIAKEMNFSETTFITSIDLDSLIFKVRIFKLRASYHLPDTQRWAQRTSFSRSSSGGRWRRSLLT